MTPITIFIRRAVNLNERFDTSWDVEREVVFYTQMFHESLNDEFTQKIAEMVFHATGAPVECITEERDKIFYNLWKAKRGQGCVSVGDVVTVKHEWGTVDAMCKHVGWETRERVIW